MQKEILLIGTGYMGIEYAKVLKGLGRDFKVIGRGEASAKKFANETGIQPVLGGLENYLSSMSEFTGDAIVAVGVNELKKTTELLLRKKCRNILLEKPAGLNLREVQDLGRAVQEMGAHVYVAYNRRFYASVLKCLEMIEADGGLKSFYFDFTEWSHVIEKEERPVEVKKEWILANSSHVLDLAFFMGGIPKKMVSGARGHLSWHPAGSIFFGAGETDKGIPFSYHSNWEAPGRWGLEFMTSNHRFFFRPMEKLHIQKKGSVQIEEVPLQDEFEKQFKPGLYLQTKAFFEQPESLLTMRQHVELTEKYAQIMKGQDI